MLSSTDGDQKQQYYVVRHSWSTLTNHLFCYRSKVRWIAVECTSVVGSLQHTDVSWWCHLTLWPAQCFRALISHWPRLLPRYTQHVLVDPSAEVTIIILLLHYLHVWWMSSRQICVFPKSPALQIRISHTWNQKDNRTFILNLSSAFNFFFSLIFL